MGAPYVNIDIVAVDVNNDGVLEETDEDACIAAMTEYARRFDIDFDDDVDALDLTWFTNTRATNPDLGKLRDGLRTPIYQELSWDDGWSCYLIQLTYDWDIWAFTGKDTDPTVFGWIHIHKHPYISGEYACVTFALDTAIASYKGLGCGCLIWASCPTHAFNVYWAGGDWTDLTNWYIVEPQNGNIFCAGDEGLGQMYQTEHIYVFDYTIAYPNDKLYSRKLDVDYTNKVVSYDSSALATYHIDLSNSSYEERLIVPYTFITTLGLPYHHGLKVQGEGELALCNAGSHPLRIRKGDTTYGIELVDTADVNASKVRIKTGTGVKAIRKYT